MDLRKIKKLIYLLEESNLAEIEIKEGEESVRLARAPKGVSWFVLERGTPGLCSDKHEDKHGIRLSDTTPVNLKDVYVPIENLVMGASALTALLTVGVIALLTIQAVGG